MGGWGNYSRVANCLLHPAVRIANLWLVFKLWGQDIEIIWRITWPSKMPTVAKICSVMLAWRNWPFRLRHWSCFVKSNFFDTLGSISSGTVTALLRSQQLREFNLALWKSVRGLNTLYYYPRQCFWARPVHQLNGWAQWTKYIVLVYWWKTLYTDYNKAHSHHLQWFEVAAYG